MEHMTAQTLALINALAEGRLNTSQFVIYQKFDKVVKNYLTFKSPIFDTIPRIPVSDMTTSWQILKRIILDTDGTYEEGENTDLVDFDFDDASATLKHQGLRGAYTDTMRDLDNKNGGINLNDQFLNTLAGLKELVELQILGGVEEALDNPTAPTVTAEVDAEVGKIPVGDYTVKVAAITLPFLHRVVKDVQIENLILKSKGHTALSSGVLVEDVEDKSVITIQVPAVKGAYGYAVFVGTPTVQRLQVVSTSNKIVLTKLTSTGQLASTITGNTTCPLTSKSKPMQFKGLTAYCLDNDGYYKSMDGNKFTSNGQEGIQEVDDMLEEMNNKYSISPTIFWVGSDVHKTFTAAATLNGGHITNIPANGRITVNNQVEVYRNPSNNLQPIVIKTHPLLPANALVAYAEEIPYPAARTPNIMDFAVLTEYHAEQFGRSKHTTEYDVSGITTFRHYAPFAIAVMTNIGKGIE